MSSSLIWRGTRDRAMKLIVLGIVWLVAWEGLAATINRLSPRNRERPKRTVTRYIVLHTTEGPEKGSLQKLHDNGEAHYFIDRRGNTYRIVERSRVAFHAGRSMWAGQSNLDDVSVGIEVSGYYNGYLTQAQYSTLRGLIGELQAAYSISDDRVLTHSMVAYGAPNRWHRRSHRGRKRCGMLFADETVRRRLGLEHKPSHDPDVKAERLVVGDPYLARMLYAKSSVPKSRPAQPPKPMPSVISEGVTPAEIAGAQYNSPEALYVLPDGRWIRGDQVKDWSQIPAGTRVVVKPASSSESAPEGMKMLGASGGSAADHAGDEYNTNHTIYFFPDGRVRNGSELDAATLQNLPGRTRLLVGYVQGGYITVKRSAFEVCGVRWNHPATYYLLPDGSFRRGDEVTEGSIPKGTQVFFPN